MENNGRWEIQVRSVARHIVKLLERIMDVRIRAVVEGEIGEEQQRFRKGRGTCDNWIIKPGEGLWYNPERNCNGNSEVDGGPRGGGQDGGWNV